MSANGPPRITFESMVVHDAKRRLRLVMELLEQEWRRQQTYGASKPHANEELHHANRRPLSHLPSPFWGKANNFYELLKFLLYYVATIKSVYNEKYHCLNIVNMLI